MNMSPELKYFLSKPAVQAALAAKDARELLKLTSKYSIASDFYL